jgi:guanine deaminase
MVLTRVASEPKKFQILLGTFIHSKSRTELEYIHDAAVAVGCDGKIAAIARDCGCAEAAKDEVLKQTGWAARDVRVVECCEGQFFFPGFIGMFALASQSRSSSSRGPRNTDT